MVNEAFKRQFLPGDLCRERPVMPGKHSPFFI
jgi:hypothetical protein